MYVEMVVAQEILYYSLCRRDNRRAELLDVANLVNVIDPLVNFSISNS